MQWFGSVVTIVLAVVLGWGLAEFVTYSDASPEPLADAALQREFLQTLELYRSVEPPAAVDEPEGLKALLDDVAANSNRMTVPVEEVTTVPAEPPQSFASLSSNDSTNAMLALNGGWRHTALGWEHVGSWYEVETPSFRQPSFHPLLFAAIQVMVVILLMFVYSSTRRRTVR